MSKQKFIDLNCCVIIPTYNNDKTLDNIIQRLLHFTSRIIIVNDGSTDRTSEILSGYPELDILSIRHNTGKGHALKLALRHAITKGYRYAITIDSDGQHFPEDLPEFLKIIEENPDSVIIGARNMKQDGVPGSSSFGHRFSIFWFRIETGLKIPDVQTGYRLYPLNYIKEIKKFYSRKYEFEVEVLVRLAWKGVNIFSIPVQIYYAPKEERVSHFRKFRDFSRVSIVNSILVFIALLWIRPFSFLKEVRKKTFKGFVKEYILDSQDSNQKIALSVSIGTLMGIMPIWGWQMIAAVGLAHVLKLNKFIALATSNISIPPMLPLILFLCYLTGGWVLGAHGESANFSSDISLVWVKQHLWQFIVGSIVFGIALSSLFGSITYLMLEIFRNKKPEKPR